MNLRVTQAMKKAARKGLRLRRQFGRGGLDTRQAHAQGVGSGVQRASNIVHSDDLPIQTWKRIKAYFDRHQSDRDAKGSSSRGFWGEDTNPSAGYVAWLLWGGDAGYERAKAVVLGASMAKRERNPVDSRFSNYLGGGIHSRVYGSGDVVQVVTRPNGKSVDMSKLVLWAARKNLTPALAAYLPDVRPLRAECHGRVQRHSEFIYTMPLYDTAVSTDDATWGGVREVLYSASDRSANLRHLVTLIENYSFRRPPAVRARCLEVADTLREVEAVAARMYAEALEVRGRPFQRYRDAVPDLRRSNMAMNKRQLLLLDPIVATLPVKDARSLWRRWTGLRVQRNDCTPFATPLAATTKASLRKEEVDELLDLLLGKQANPRSLGERIDIGTGLASTMGFTTLETTTILGDTVYISVLFTDTQMVGMIETRFSDDCNDAFVVAASGIAKDWQGTGLGVLLYSLALYDLEYMAPDRFSVSPEAKRIWSRMRDQVGIYQTNSIRDEDDMFGSDDECRLHYDATLDSTYTLTSGARKRLKPVHDLMDRTATKIMKTSGLSTATLKKRSDDLFSDVYI